jgi:hypothetical protein
MCLIGLGLAEVWVTFASVWYILASIVITILKHLLY